MDPLTDESRLRALHSTRLLDSPPEHAFDRLTRMAARLVDAPAALVSLVDDHRQFFKSAYGLGEPWASRRETPLGHSFCQYVVRDRSPLIVTDAREHPTLRTNLAVADLGVIAYAGIPLIVNDEAIGALCVVDDKPRVWSATELELLADLAASVVSEIELRIALREAREHRALTETLLDSLGDGVLAIDTNQTLLIANTAARRMFSEGAEAGKPLPPRWSTRHRSILRDGSPLAPEDGALARALRGEPTDDLEFTLEPLGAEAPVWVEANGRPVRDASGAVLAGVAVYRDVTERKRRVDLFAALARNIPRGAVVLFDHGLRCLAVDGEIARAEGVDPQQAIGRTLRELAGRAGAGPAFNLVEDACRRTLDGHSVRLDFALADRTVELHTAPARDGLGQITSGIMLALDVTEQRRDQAAVGRSEQLYRAIVQNLPNGAVFMVDKDLRYLSADGAALAEIMESTTVPAHDLVGRTVQEVVSAKNRDATVAMLAEAFRGTGRRVDITRGAHTYELVTEPIVDASSNGVSAVLLFCFDVTERRRAHDAVARERELLIQFRAFIEHIPVGILILSDDRIAYANPAMLGILGYAHASLLVGLPVLETIIHPDERADAAERMRAARSTEVLPRRGRYLRRDGTPITVEATGQPVEFEGHASVIVACRDVTDEVALELARRANVAALETFRLMVEAVKDYAIFQLDRDGRVQTWNAGARAITGYEADEIVGQHLRIFYPPEDQGRPDVELATAASNERYHEEGWRLRKDGSRFWASIVLTALHDPSTREVSGFVQVARDLTEPKQVEDARARSLAEKTAMLQEIHHRVKNNLQMISSLLNLQARHIRDPDARAIFLGTQSRVRSIAMLHENLYQSDDLGRVDMQEYVHKLVATLRRAYGESSPVARFTIEIERIFLPLDAAVPCGLIINELVTNALKHAFSDARDPRDEITVDMHRSEAHVVLSVADNGAGFGPAVDPARDESMGLVLVRDLSTQLGGVVDFTSARGASCRIQFPAPADNAARP